MIESLNADESQPKKDFSPGQLLLQGRLQAGLTQEQIAKELYMTVYKVKALETDDYSRLSSDTFARGYIRAYANLVKIDVVLVLAAYDQFVDGLKPKTELPVQVTAAETGHRGAWQFLLVIGAFFLGLWLISVWFFDNHSEAQYAAPAAGLSAVAEVKSSLPASSEAAIEVSKSGVSESVVSAVNTISATESAEGSKTVKVEASASAQSNAASSITISSLATVTQISTSSAAKKTSLDEISFSFRAESWLEVSDSRGDVLATELESSGSTIKLVGLAPFDVKLGNAPAVDIQLNGKKIDVIPLLGSNVLILKVGN
jgi:cytoskeleton protein RodZ